MNYFYCWHRPGRLLRSVRLCRFCGIAIEECPCEPRKRCESPCPLCEGSHWVGIVRSRAAIADAVLGLMGTRGLRGIELWR